MPLQLIRDDITRVKCDAIVNAANTRLAGGGGVDGAIHAAAGPGLHEECMTLGGCPVGEARITGGYALPCRYIIHTVGPVWFGGGKGEAEQLASCYRSSLALALSHGCESVAFPMISTGAFGYPADQALRIAVDEITRFLMENEMLVYIVVFDRHSFRISGRLASGIEEFIDENYVDSHNFAREQSFTLQSVADEKPSGLRKLLNIKPGKRPGKASEEAAKRADAEPAEDMRYAMPRAAQDALPAYGASDSTRSLTEILGTLDESFSQMLLRKIDERGMTDAECYKRANIDRKLFSKIRSDVNYKPSKPTAIAFAIALELPLEETRDMLMKAGFALSHSNKFDVIVEYFIRNRNYNVFEINEALFAFDQALLGA